MKQEFFQNEDWTLELPVTDEDTGLAKDMSSATVSAVAKVGTTTASLTSTGTATSIRVEFDPDTFPVGYGELQVKATIGADTQVWGVALVSKEALEVA